MKLPCSHVLSVISNVGFPVGCYFLRPTKINEPQSLMQECSVVHILQLSSPGIHSLLKASG